MASKKRVCCGLAVAAVWLIAIFALPPYILAGILALSAGVCLYELCAMLKKVGYALPFGELAVATAVWFGAVYLSGSGDHAPGQSLLLGLLVVLIAALFFRVLLDARFGKPMETASLTVTAFLYVPVSLSFFIPFLWIGAWLGSLSAGVFFAFFLVLITKLCDTGGYFIGTAFGKHKMSPRLSPGKSWEGTAGGFAFSLSATAIVVACAHLFPKAHVLGLVRLLTDSVGATVWFFAVVAILVAVGICGDLLESLFKRQCGVKDSSALFPAMGGFFDTFDSVIFVPGVAYFLLFVVPQI